MKHQRRTVFDPAVRLGERCKNDVAFGHDFKSASVYCGSSSPYAAASEADAVDIHSARSGSGRAEVGSTVTVNGVPGGWGDPDGNGAHGLNERRGVRSVFVGRDFLNELIKTYADSEL